MTRVSTFASTLAALPLAVGGQSNRRGPKLFALMTLRPKEWQ